MDGEEYRVSKEETVADKMMVKAMVAHQGQFREGAGHIPYIVHPASVVIRLKRWGYTEEKNPNVLAIGWGHDLLEDTEVPEWEIAALTNGEVLKGIKMLTFKPPKGIGDEEFDRLKADYIREIAEKAPLDVLAVKLADRICNAHDRLGGMSTEERAKAKETLEKGKALFARLEELPCAAAVKGDLLDIEYAIKEGIDPKWAMDIWDSDYELGTVY